MGESVVVVVVGCDFFLDKHLSRKKKFETETSLLKLFFPPSSVSLSRAR